MPYNNSNTIDYNNDKLIMELTGNIELFNYYQYIKYPSRNENSWKQLLINSFEKDLKNNEIKFFIEHHNNIPLFIKVHTSKWDEEHFGIKISKMTLINPKIENESYSKKLRNLIKYSLTELKENHTRLITVRINGDDLDTIHSFESLGFRYFENVIWPVLKCKTFENTDNKNIRLMQEDDIEEVRHIASHYQYQRGHYHCENQLNKKKVNSLYSKWIDTAFISEDPIIVIRDIEKIVGYFVLKIDSQLSNYLGYNYGRMKSLAIDSNIRGKGIGKSIFNGAINYLKTVGMEFIDSGYSTKNHLSAKLHSSVGFYSVYEEITLHKWI